MVFAHNLWAGARFSQPLLRPVFDLQMRDRLNATSLDMRVSPSERAVAAIIRLHAAQSCPRRFKSQREGRRKVCRFRIPREHRYPLEEMYLWWFARPGRGASRGHSATQLR